MKIRAGFVSNSSSSSFCIIGLDLWDNDKMVQAIAKHANMVAKNAEWPEPGQVQLSNGHLYIADTVESEALPGWQLIGSDGTASYLGLEAEKLLQTMTIPDACAMVRMAINRKFGLDVEVEFLFGEVSSG